MRPIIAFGASRSTSGSCSLSSQRLGRMAPTANGAGYSNPGITRRGFTLTDPERLERLGRATIGPAVLHGRGIGARV